VEQLQIRHLSDDGPSERRVDQVDRDLSSLKSPSSPEVSSAETGNLHLDSDIIWQHSKTTISSHCETVLGSPLNILSESPQEGAVDNSSLPGSLYSYKNDCFNISYELEEEDFPGRCARVDMSYIQWTPNENYQPTLLFKENQDDEETKQDSWIARRLMFETNGGSTEYGDSNSSNIDD